MHLKVQHLWDKVSLQRSLEQNKTEKLERRDDREMIPKYLMSDSNIKIYLNLTIFQISWHNFPFCLKIFMTEF